MTKRGCNVIVRDCSKLKRKAQISMEYLIIFAVAFSMTIPLVIIYARQTGNIQADVTQAQMYKVASKISDYAEQVYYMGERRFLIRPGSLLTSTASRSKVYRKQSEADAPVVIP